MKKIFSFLLIFLLSFSLFALPDSSSYSGNNSEGRAEATFSLATNEIVDNSTVLFGFCRTSTQDVIEIESLELKEFYPSSGHAVANGDFDMFFRVISSKKLNIKIGWTDLVERATDSSGIKLTLKRITEVSGASTQDTLTVQNGSTIFSFDPSNGVMAYERMQFLITTENYLRTSVENNTYFSIFTLTLTEEA